MVASDYEEVKKFRILRHENAQIEEWVKTHEPNCSVKGWYEANTFTPTSKLQYCFRPSGIGTSLKVVCICGETFEPEIDY